MSRLPAVAVNATHDGYLASCSHTFWVPRLPASQIDAFMILHEAGVFCKQQDIFPAFIYCILSRKHVSTLPLHFASSLQLLLYPTANLLPYVLLQKVCPSSSRELQERM